MALGKMTRRRIETQGSNFFKKGRGRKEREKNIIV